MDRRSPSGRQDDDRHPAGPPLRATALQRRHSDVGTPDRALRASNPVAQRWESLTPIERWERSTLAEMFEMSLYYERGPMVLDDLRGLPDSPLIIAEGVTLPAFAASTGIAERTQMVWLCPTAEFQDAQLAAVETTKGHVALYRHLRDVTEQEAREHGIPTLTVDGSLGVSEMVEKVERLFRDVLDSGPSAQTLDERRRLLREINEAIVDQVRGYHPRPLGRGEPRPRHPILCLRVWRSDVRG